MVTCDLTNEGSLWQIVLTIIAIKYKNTMQVVAVSLFNYAFLPYAVLMVSELAEPATAVVCPG